MRLLGVLALVVACGGNNSAKKDGAIDSPKHDAHVADGKVFMDAPGPDAPQHVVSVSCTGVTPDATVTTASFAFSPSAATVPVNGIVKFMAESIHDVASGNTNGATSIADPGLTCAQAATCCLKFTTSGTYGYHCGLHPMMNGTVTVQ